MTPDGAAAGTAEESWGAATRMGRVKRLRQPADARTRLPPLPLLAVQRLTMLAVLVLAVCGARGAGTFVVTTAADAGRGSLREAIQSANASDGGAIVFSGVTGAIVLSNALPAIEGRTSIAGPGTKLLTISGNRAVPVFAVVGEVTFSGLTIASGAHTGGNGATGAVSIDFVGRSGGAGTNGQGGGLYNQGTAWLINCAFATNSATGGKGGNGSGGLHRGGNGGPGGRGEGGAIYNLGLLYLSNCTFSGNSVVGGDGGAGGSGPEQGPGYGGVGGAAAGAALYNAARASATLINCTFSTHSVRAGHSAGGTPFDGFNGRTGASGGEAQGGSIFNLGTTLLLNCAFSAATVTGGNGGAGGDASGHRGGDGGAGGRACGGSLYNGGFVGMTNCTFASGAASGGAGAAGGSGLAQGPGYGGRGGWAGGGALFNAAMGVVDSANCTFHTNSARAGQTAGGAPFDGFNGRTGTAGAAAEGGAVCNLGTYTLVNCTFDGNTATGGNGGAGGDASGHYGGAGGPGGSARGGAFCNDGFVNAVNCTFARGTANGGTGGEGGSGDLGSGAAGSVGEGYGAQIGNRTGTFQLQNSILGYPQNATNADGPIGDQGHNLSSDGSPAFSDPTSRNNRDPQLAPLANNGGPTSTLALLPGSPAIDAGTSAVGPAADQRGVPRPQGTAVDLGALEAVLDAPALAAPAWRPTAGFSVSVFCDSTNAYRVQATTNLSTWTTLTNYATGGSAQFLDSSATNFPRRVYRTISP